MTGPGSGSPVVASKQSTPPREMSWSLPGPPTRRSLPVPTDIGISATRLKGGKGTDLIVANDGDEGETMFGKDIINAGAGDDMIHTLDGHEDIIDCGSGKDTVTFDKGINTDKTCEQ